MNATVTVPTDTSPDQNLDGNVELEREQEQEHCTICLQSFLDRTIVPVCAHEFCFECILVWSEQSRKCPLCARSFEDAYLIHHVRSQHDYQKHYLPPLRSSPPPPLASGSRVNPLRNTRRERQWGRRQRREREEQDQLERAIARRRWIYQHHLYAKHVASNAFTRYRPFPTPAQFAASPDLIRRMTTFLRRELRVWPNLDVEFLTTYTISLVKSIDIRSESAVKLLSEFLDLDAPYAAGARHANAEHFAHEIYSYLRSPYRDLNVYDQSVQYDTPSEIPLPREMERGRRWDAEFSPSRPSRSRSHSRHRSLREHRSPVARDVPTDVCNDRSPYGLEDGSSPDSRRGSLHDGSHDRVPSPSSVVLAETQDDVLAVQPRFRDDEKGKARATDGMEGVVATDASTPIATTPRAGGPLDKAGLEVVGGDVSNRRSERRRLAGSSVRPRNRTLSESVQAYLSRPVAARCPTKASGEPEPGRPSLLFRLADGPIASTRDAC